MLATLRIILRPIRWACQTVGLVVGLAVGLLACTFHVVTLVTMGLAFLLLDGPSGCRQYIKMVCAAGEGDSWSIRRVSHVMSVDFTPNPTEDQFRWN